MWLAVGSCLGSCHFKPCKLFPLVPNSKCRAEHRGQENNWILTFIVVAGPLVGIRQASVRWTVIPALPRLESVCKPRIPQRGSSYPFDLPSVVRTVLSLWEELMAGLGAHLSYRTRVAAAARNVTDCYVSSQRKWPPD